MNNQEQTMKEQVIGVFDRAAPTYGQVGPRFFTHFGQRLVELAGLPAGARALDVATGRGAVLLAAQAAVGPEGFVFGIDLSQTMVQETQLEIMQRNLPNVRVMMMDGEKLSFPTASFDAVLCGFGIFFFPEPLMALQEYFRVLKPGGRLGFTTWGQGDARWQWLENLGPTRPPGTPQPKFTFDRPDGLKEFVSEAGFEQIQVIHEEMDFTYADETEWLNTQWSHGIRGVLERIPPQVLEQMKPDIFARIQPLKQPDGIHQLFRTLFTFAVKPKSQGD